MKPAADLAPIEDLRAELPELFDVVIEHGVNPGIVANTVIISNNANSRPRQCVDVQIPPVLSIWHAHKQIPGKQLRHSAH